MPREQDKLRIDVKVKNVTFCKALSQTYICKLKIHLLLQLNEYKKNISIRENIPRKIEQTC